MKWIVLLLPFSFLTACTGSNTDALEPHQIVAAPINKWVHWNEEVPVDVTEDKIIKAKRICPERYVD